MEWTDQGVVLSSRRHGEGAAILELLTRDRGRHMGLVRGGASARSSQSLQPGNTLNVTWRARLAEHLGTYRCEMETARAAALIEARTTVAGVQTLAALAHLLAERDPVPGLYEALELVLDAMVDDGPWPALLVRWEIGLLTELGFGIDLSACAATGSPDDLAYVSPKSGRAVSRAAGLPYHDRLLALPGFLTGGRGEPAPGDIAAGFRLSGHFFERDVFGPRGLSMPSSRARLINMLAG
ncbi:MAG: DNA repair protein RecO [Rhizobiales bacterium]|nr:DNA repair protein RecO [Hyphomicrobiales bacterium]